MTCPCPAAGGSAALPSGAAVVVGTLHGPGDSPGHWQPPARTKDGCLAGGGGVSCVREEAGLCVTPQHPRSG